MTARLTNPGLVTSRTWTFVASECFTAFASASCVTRYRGRLDIAGQPEVGLVEVGDDLRPRALKMGLDVPAQRGDEAEVVEHDGPQVVDDQLDLVHGVGDQRLAVHHLGVRTRRVVVLDGLVAQVEAHEGGRERLAGLVVELAAYPPALLLHAAELPLGVRERLRPSR